MVTHDYERGVISGLPKSVLDHVRRTGTLPDDAMSVNLRAVWEAVAWQKAHADPPGMTVAEIQRQFMGGDDAFDPEVWQRLTGGKAPFSPALEGVDAPGGVDKTPQPEATVAIFADCSCGQSVADIVSAAAPCGDGGLGSASAVVQEFQDRGLQDFCDGKFTCKGGDRCKCREEALIKVGIYANASNEMCADHGGFADPAKILCHHGKDSRGVDSCLCWVRCKDGTAAPTTDDGTGWPTCEDAEAGDSTVAVSKPGCGRGQPDSPAVPGVGGPGGSGLQAGLLYTVSRVGGCVHNKTLDVTVDVYACEEGRGPVSKRTLAPGQSTPCDYGDPDWDHVHVKFGTVDAWYKVQNWAHLALRGDRWDGVRVNGDACGGRRVSGLCAPCP